MQLIKIRTEKSVYEVGDTVEGEMIVECDKEFGYNRIYLTATGKEHTQIVRSPGKTVIFYTDSRIHFNDRRNFGLNETMQPGIIHFPFSFKLPDNSPSSYFGGSGWIQYILTGKIEIPHSKDVKADLEIRVKKPMRNVRHNSVQAFAERDGDHLLDIEMERDTFCLGDDVTIRYRISPNIKIRKVRFELLAKENATAKDVKNRLTYVFQKKEVDEIELTRSGWMETKLSTKDTMPLTIKEKLIQVELALEITLDIPWAKDKSVVVPIIMGHCSKKNI